MTVARSAWRQQAGWFLTSAALLAIIILALGGCGQGEANESGEVNAKTGLTMIAPQDRQPAPQVSGIDLAGNPLSTSQFPQKVLVLNVWGSWCAPCRYEAPILETVWKEKSDRAQFLGINTRDASPAQAIAFERNFGITYPSFYDGDGQVLMQYSSVLPPQAIPSTLLIDPNGMIAARIVGIVDEKVLAGLIDDLADGQ